MRISVVTVTYNVANSVGLTLESIRGQTYPDLEMIIVDGGSTDGTVELLEPYRQAGAIIISEPDQGIYDAMNKGVALAKGAYVNFMNAGDCFADKDVVTKLVTALKNGGGDYVYGNVLSVYENGEKLAYAHAPTYLWRNKPFNHQGLFAARPYLQDHPFDLTYRLVADYHQTYAASKAGAVLRRLPDLTVASVDMTTGASKRSFWQTVTEKIRVNWRMASNKPRVVLYLCGHLPYLTTLYLLRRLGIFEWLMVRLGRQKAEA